MPNVPQILCPKCHKPARPTARFCNYCGHDLILNNAGPRYYITRVIKEGGQGAVFEAVGDDDRVYAVKEMLDRFNDPEERADAIKRFEAEAELLERLSHPRIPKVYAHFQDEKRHYLAMDFIRGEDLEDIVDREGAQPEARVLEWADQICDVLEYLHAHGLIYRDMKPSNVMVDHQAGGIKVIDFGIAKVLQQRTRGTQIGTPGYAPPEQYQGLATQQSDIYALAATLHHLVTGRDPTDFQPFSFPPARSVRPEISQQTSAVLERALEMRPEDRFQSMGELRAALKAAPAPRASAAAQPAAAAARPAGPAPQPRPAASTSRTPPVGLPPAPAPSSARPAAPSAPARPAPAPQPAQPAAARRGISLGRCLFWLIVGPILTCGLLTLLPLLGSEIPNIIPGLGATPQTLVAQPFSVENLEIIVPRGTDETGLYAAYVYAFGEVARSQLGPDIQVQADSVSYTNGPPQRISADAQGAKFRASLQGTVLVPQR